MVLVLIILHWKTIWLQCLHQASLFTQWSRSTASFTWSLVLSSLISLFSWPQVIYSHNSQYDCLNIKVIPRDLDIVMQCFFLDVGEFNIVPSASRPIPLLHASFPTTFLNHLVLAVHPLSMPIPASESGHLLWPLTECTLPRDLGYILSSFNSVLGYHA